MSLLLDVAIALFVGFVVFVVVLPAYARAKQERVRTSRLQTFEQRQGAG